MPAVGDMNVRVQVNGTTFAAVYKRIGPTLELLSADFGDHSIEIGREAPKKAAESLLRTLVEQAIQRGVLFVRDDGTAGPTNESPND